MLAVVALLTVVAACWRGRHGIGGSSAAFENDGYLISHYVYDGSDEPVSVCHVLFVPQWDPPRVNYGFEHASAGDDRQYSFRISYKEQGVRQFDARPLTVARRYFADVFQGGGRTFNLDDGNIFVVAVHRDGSLGVTQVPRLDGMRRPAEILAVVQKALPNDVRVQALKPLSV